MLWDFPWIFHGFSMVFPWFFHIFHGFSIFSMFFPYFPWIFHGFSMVSMFFPWIFPCSTGLKPTWMVSVLCFTSSAMVRSVSAEATEPAMVDTTCSWRSPGKWCPSSLDQLVVYKSHFTMVYGRYNELVNGITMIYGRYNELVHGVYEPTYNMGH